MKDLNAAVSALHVHISRGGRLVYHFEFERECQHTGKLVERSVEFFHCCEKSDLSWNGACPQELRVVVKWYTRLPIREL